MQRLGVLAAAVATLVSTFPVGTTTERATATTVDASSPGPPLEVPPVGTMFGAAVQKTGAGSGFPAVESLESQLGRPLDIYRMYAYWNTDEPMAVLQQAMNEGVIPLLSIDTTMRSGAAVSWSSIAAGEFDATIIRQATALESIKAPILLAFDHEPELDLGSGDAAEYVAAWRHYVEVFRQHGATNVSFVLILQHTTYSSSTVRAWYPGDSYVDWVGADGYNALGCRGVRVQSWTTFQELFAGLNDFAVAHAKPAVVAEWASTEDSAVPGRKAQWIAAAAKTLEGWPQIKAVSYFDAPGHVGTACDWPPTSSASAMNAWLTMSAAAYFNPRPRAVLAASPDPVTVWTPAKFDTTGTEDMNHSLTSWQFDFGDGTAPRTGSGAPPRLLSHSYAAGRYEVVLIVTDSVGLSDRSTLQLVVSSGSTATLRMTNRWARVDEQA